MKVRAKHWLNYNGVWYKGGEIFEADDFNEVKEHADKLEDETESVNESYISEIFPPADEPADQPKKRGRPKKTED